MTGRAASEVSAARWRTVWRKHDDGTAARAIARDLAIAEGTVRYYLRLGRPPGLPASLPRDHPRDHAPASHAASDAVVTHLADRRKRA